jgi:hypothetical protein
MKTILMWQCIVASILMGFYMHLVFWGGIPLGSLRIEPFTPEADFWSAILYIGIPGVLYVFSQALPVATRPQMAVWLLFMDWAASIFPIAETYLVLIQFAFGAYIPSTFQSGALAIWTWTEAIDLLFFVISSLLLRRSIGVVTEAA